MGKAKTSVGGDRLKASRTVDVSVRKSGIKGAGMGLFAARDLPAKTRLPAPYKGRKLTWEAFLKTRDQRWCYTVDDGKTWAVDGKALKRGNPLRYVNGAKTAAQKRRVNVVGFRERGQIWYVTTRTVPRNTEFLIDYGPGYWQALDRQWGQPQRLKAKVKELKLELKKGVVSASRRRMLQEKLEDLEDDLFDLQ